MQRIGRPAPDPISTVDSVLSVPSEAQLLAAHHPQFDVRVAAPGAAECCNHVSR